MFWSTRKTFKKDSNDYIINDLWFSVTYLFCIICRTKICRICLKIQFSAIFKQKYDWISTTTHENWFKSLCNSHQWFRLACIILCNLKNTNLQIFPTKTPHVNRITDYQQKKYKKKGKKFKTLLQAFTRNFSWILSSCVIYIRSTDHAQID